MGRVRRRRGAIEIQFNWMFVMIAGAIILSFFVLFVVKQKDAADQKLGAALIKNLESELTTARVSGGTAAKIPLQDLELLFSCEDYRVKDLSESINNRAIFSPDRVEGRTMYLWSVPWSLPFKITNLLFITSPSVRYVFIDTDSNVGLLRSVHSRMSTKFVNLHPIVSEGDFNTVDVYDVDKLKIVCFDCDDVLPQLDMSRFVRFADPDVKALSINSNTKEVNFFFMNQNKLESEGVSPFFGIDSDSEATMYAAIFSDDKYTYDCNMKKALNTFLIVAEVYRERAKKIEEGIDETSGLVPASCSDYYTQPYIYLNKLIGAAKNDFTDPSLNQGMCESMIRNAQSLDNYQNEIIRGKSCPLVY